MDYMPLIYFVITVVLYAVLGYLKTVGPKTWDWTKVAATAIVAIVVALANYKLDFIPTEEWVAGTMLMFAGAIYAVENFLKWLFRNTPIKKIPVNLWK